MNNARRKTIDALIDALSDLTPKAEEVRDEEQEAFDNMPESLQDGDRGQAAQEAIDALEEALTALEEASAALENAKG